MERAATNERGSWKYEDAYRTAYSAKLNHARIMENAARYRLQELDYNLIVMPGTRKRKAAELKVATNRRVLLEEAGGLRCVPGLLNGHFGTYSIRGTLNGAEVDVERAYEWFPGGQRSYRKWYSAGTKDGQKMSTDEANSIVTRFTGVLRELHTIASQKS